MIPAALSPRFDMARAYKPINKDLSSPPFSAALFSFARICCVATALDDDPPRIEDSIDEVDGFWGSRSGTRVSPAFRPRRHVLWHRFPKRINIISGSARLGAGRIGHRVSDIDQKSSPIIRLTRRRLGAEDTPQDINVTRYRLKVSTLSALSFTMIE